MSMSNRDSSIFNNMKKYVIGDYIDPTTNNINNILIPQIKTNQKSIDKQNKVLERLLKAEKMKALETQILVFLLEKLYSIESLQ